MDTDHNAAPINPLPWVVWVLALPMVAVEVTLSLAARGVIGGQTGIGWRLQAVQDYGFLNAVFDWMVENRSFPTEHLIRFVTYPFIHGNFTHALFVVVFVLALGKMVGEVFRPWAVLVVFFGSAIMGAVVYGAVLNDPLPLIGGYPGVYGLIGAFSFLNLVMATIQGTNRLRAFRLIGFLLATQLLFSVIGGGNGMWVADVAGFGAGFLLSFLVSPGGWVWIVGRIRGV